MEHKKWCICLLEECQKDYTPKRARYSKEEIYHQANRMAESRSGGRWSWELTQKDLSDGGNTNLEEQRE